MIDLLPAFQKCNESNAIPAPSPRDLEILETAGRDLAFFFGKHGIKTETCIIPGEDYPKLILLAEDIDGLIEEAQRHKSQLCGYASLFNVTSNINMAPNPRARIPSDLPGDIGDNPDLKPYPKGLVLRTPPAVTAKVVKSLIQVTPISI